MELFFFPFLLSSCCHSIVYRFVCIVSDGYNQSSFVFFYLVFEPLYRYINAVFDAGIIIIIIIICVIWPKEISSNLSYTQNNDCN